MRRMTSGMLALALAVAVGEGLSACGDKFLRIGRELRFGRYVAIYPATILIYAPPKSAPARVSDLSTVLKRAGHATTVVQTSADLASTLRPGRFDLVLAGLDQASEVTREARLAASHPDVMPVLIAPRQPEMAAAKSLSTCLINASAPHRNDALAEIDHRMELRLTAGATTGEPRR